MGIGMHHKVKNCNTYVTNYEQSLRGLYYFSWTDMNWSNAYSCWKCLAHKLLLKRYKKDPLPFSVVGCWRTFFVVSIKFFLFKILYVCDLLSSIWSDRKWGYVTASLTANAEPAVPVTASTTDIGTAWPPNVRPNLRAVLSVQYAWPCGCSQAPPTWRPEYKTLPPLRSTHSNTLSRSFTYTEAGNGLRVRLTSAPGNHGRLCAFPVQDAGWISRTRAPHGR